MISLMEEELPTPEKPQVVVEIARPQDAAGIANVQKATWLATYPNEEYGISYDDVAAKVALWDSPESLNRIRQSIMHPDPGTLRLVARDKDKVVGHCYAIKRGHMNKLQVLYVLPQYQHMGIGSRLANEGIGWLGSDKDIGLEVVKYSTDAINFYESLGFRVTGDALNSVTKLPSGITIPTYSMVRKGSR